MRKIRGRAGRVVALWLAVLAGPVGAEPGLRFSGFGTAGYVRDNRDDVAPARDISQAPDDNFATGASWKVDSRFGMQFEYGIGKDVDLVAQFVVRDQFMADADSATELAYLAVRPDARFDLRGGRVGYDAFLMADHRNVGYAYPWVRPPAEFYSWIPIFSIDGFDIAYTLPGEAARWRFKVQAGRSLQSLSVAGAYEFRARNLLSASVSRHADVWRAKAAFSQFTVGSEVPGLDPLRTGLDQVAAALPPLAAEASDLRRNTTFAGARVTYLTLGAAYDDGIWLAQAEVGRSTATTAVIPHGRMAYASLGRRFGDWMPHVMLAMSRPGNDVRAAVNDWGALNATVRDPALFVVNSTRIDQRAAALGVRWDFHRQAALKLQWDRTRIRPSGYGLWWRAIPLNHRGNRIDTVTTTVDFVF